MSKSQKKTATTKKKSQPVTLPPLVACALAKFADPELAAIDPQFLEAYAKMPALVESFIRRGTNDDVWGVIGAVSGLTAAERKADTGATSPDRTKGDRFAHAIAVLNHTDSDLECDLVSPVMHGAFLVGLAYASYMLLERRDGAR